MGGFSHLEEKKGGGKKLKRKRTKERTSLSREKVREGEKSFLSTKKRRESGTQLQGGGRKLSALCETEKRKGNELCFRRKGEGRERDERRKGYLLHVPLLSRRGKKKRLKHSYYRKRGEGEKKEG